jgi:hypothetical protein
MGMHVRVRAGVWCMLACGCGWVGGGLGGWAGRTAACCAEVRPRPASSLGLSRPPRPATPTEVSSGAPGGTLKAESEGAEKPQKPSFAFMAIGRDSKLTG